MSEPPSAVFIAGNGHSGSTLLESMLLDGGATVGLGELGQTLAASLRLGPGRHLSGRTCLCGAEVPSCALWSELVPELERRWRRESLDLVDAYATVIGATRRLHPSATVVDSSKNPRYLHLLEAAVDGPVGAVHLVRDVRSWAVSSGRKAAQHRPAGIRRISHRWHLSGWARFGTWRQRNTAIERELRRRPQDYVLASYEGLATVGPNYVAALRELLSMPAAAATQRGAATSHAIHGNRARTSLRDGAAVVYSTDWLFEPGWALVSALRPSIMRSNRRWVGTTATRPVRLS